MVLGSGKSDHLPIYHVQPMWLSQYLMSKMAMKPTLKLNTLYIYLINDTFVYVLIKIYTCDMVINICTMENVDFSHLIQM